MVRAVIPFRRPPRDDEADAFVADRLRDEQGQPISPRAGQDEVGEVWDALGQLDAADFDLDDRRSSSGLLSRRGLIAGGAIAAGFAIGGVLLWNQRPVAYQTAVGERRTVALPDGSRVTLNTATRLVARFGGDRREVVLEAGEALFAVAHRDGAPFDVLSQGGRIRVTGTRFNVYRQAGFTQVDLLEGGVTAGSAEDGSKTAVRLAPGQAVRLSPSGRPGPIFVAQAARIDDWNNGRISFVGASLTEAVAEMNRYSRTPMRIATPSLGRLQVDGVFEAGDTAAFARAVGRLHKVSVRTDGRSWTLS
ncbi:anti-sigma factor [Caulobacter zeae]|uniref:Anti-sigma factor n=1 Tax=Caulobacter zeae TaxID=2055137 RepID=A0A2N5D962_9CAUL|nr:FecR domain-containing protein [Caulobacter zeae]PLR22604.1 anti-sigma factor [Caulobacter zeae]